MMDEFLLWIAVVDETPLVLGLLQLGVERSRDAIHTTTILMA